MVINEYTLQRHTRNLYFNPIIFYVARQGWIVVKIWSKNYEYVIIFCIQHGVYKYIWIQFVHIIIQELLLNANYQDSSPGPSLFYNYRNTGEYSPIQLCGVRWRPDNVDSFNRRGGCSQRS